MHEPKLLHQQPNSKGRWKLIQRPFDYEIFRSRLKRERMINRWAIYVCIDYCSSLYSVFLCSLCTTIFPKHINPRQYKSKNMKSINAQSLHKA